MKILIAEDDFASRKFLRKFLTEYGDCDLVVDGMEAIDAFMMANKMNEPYNLICLDIMMPKVDGIKVLKTVREMESQNGISPENAVKIIMTSALNQSEIVHDSFNAGSEGYVVKPLNTQGFIDLLHKLKLID
jgi:two-component system chemotaxis response regulator CheY